MTIQKDLRWRMVALAVLVVAVSVLHYSTQTSKPLLHDVYRRLYYLPVGLSAVWFGLRGGLTTSLAVILLYVPHILLHWHHAERELVNQFMEMGLYVVFAGAVGYFADEERRLRKRYQEAADKLDRSFQELRRQADMILDIEAQLRRADRLTAVGQLAAGLTHEIRNPLGAIKGTAEILRDDFPASHPKAEFLDILIRETERLNQVVEDFLGFARHREGESPAEIVDLREVVRETATLLEAPARKAGVRVELRAQVPLCVHGSPAQLKQVLVNLLLNAIQATPPEGSVRLVAEAVDGKVQGLEYREVEGKLATVVVDDEGEGIAEEHLEKVFDPFFTTKPEGTGLGLAISQRIVHAHGGSLEASNREGGGARFTVTLPLIDGGEGEHA